MLKTDMDRITKSIDTMANQLKTIKNTEENDIKMSLIVIPDKKIISSCQANVFIEPIDYVRILTIKQNLIDINAERIEIIKEIL
jgi:hypothetical protein